MFYVTFLFWTFQICSSEHLLHSYLWWDRTEEEKFLHMYLIYQVPFYQYQYHFIRIVGFSIILVMTNILKMDRPLILYCIVLFYYISSCLESFLFRKQFCFLLNTRFQHNTIILLRRFVWAGITDCPTTFSGDHSGVQIPTWLFFLV